MNSRTFTCPVENDVKVLNRIARSLGAKEIPPANKNKRKACSAIEAQLAEHGFFTDHTTGEIVRELEAVGVDEGMIQVTGALTSRLQESLIPAREMATNPVYTESLLREVKTTDQELKESEGMLKRLYGAAWSMTSIGMSYAQRVLKTYYGYVMWLYDKFLKHPYIVLATMFGLNIMKNMLCAKFKSFMSVGRQDTYADTLRAFLGSDKVQIVVESVVELIMAPMNFLVVGIPVFGAAILKLLTGMTGYYKEILSVMATTALTYWVYQQHVTDAEFKASKHTATLAGLTFLGTFLTLENCYTGYSMRGYALELFTTV